MIELNEVGTLNVKELEGKLLSLSDNTGASDCKLEFSEVRAVFLIKTEKGLRTGQMLSVFSNSPKIDNLNVGKHYRFTVAVNENEDKLLLFFLPHRTLFELLSNLKEEDIENIIAAKLQKKSY